MRAFLLLLFVGYTSQSLCQDFNYIHYTSNDGLPSSEVYEVIQDSKGYIWIATDNGISQFDGYQFRHYQNEEGLADQVAFHLQEDQEGRIWVSTLSSKIYVYDQGSIRPFRYNSIIQQYETDFRRLHHFYVDSVGTFHGAYAGLGILSIDTSGHHIVHRIPNYANNFFIDIEDHPLLSYYKPPHEASQSRYSDTILGQIDDRHLVFEVTGLADYNPGLAKVHSFKLFQKYYLFSAGNIIWLFDGDQLLFSRKVSAFIDSYTITSDGAVILGFTQQKGAVIYANWDAFLKDQGSHILEGYTVSHLMEDRAKGLWITTVQDGIFYIPSLHLSLYDHRSPFSVDNVIAVEKMADHKIAVGLVNGRVFTIDKLGKIALFSDNAYEIRDLVYTQKDNTLWQAGLPKKGPMGIFGSHSQENLYFKKASGITFSARKIALNAARNKLLFCVSGENGFSQVDLSVESDSLHYYPYPNFYERTHAVLEDFNGNLFIGKNDGLYQYSKHGLQKQKTPGLDLSVRVESIKILSDSTIVIGTKGKGVILWKGKQVSTITEEEGYSS
ncbi:MAG: two-component regulator propeller domain-containing protein [Bacteroidota bacterium]